MLLDSGNLRRSDVFIVGGLGGVTVGVLVDMSILPSNNLDSSSSGLSSKESSVCIGEVFLERIRLLIFCEGKQIFYVHEGRFSTM